MTFVTHVSVTNGRCHSRLSLDFQPGVNILVGGNGAGKTTVLEAISLVLAGKSPRTSVIRSMIKHGETAMRIEVDVCEARLGGVGGRTARAAAGFDAKGEKRHSLNGVALENDERLRALVIVRAFLPDDLRLVKGSPSRRRTFIDALAAHQDREYEFHLQSYKGALEQRNALLRVGRLGAENIPWEEILAREGLVIASARMGALASFAPSFARMAGVFGLDRMEPVRLVYRTNTEGMDEEECAIRLAACRGEDRRRTFTHIGPHRDDMRFIRGGVDLREGGSQGEQRAVVLSLLLAEVIWLESVGGPLDDTVLLLDDVLSELDENRRKMLMESLRQCGQSVLTTTDLGCVDVQSLDAAHVIRISSKGEESPNG